MTTEYEWKPTPELRWLGIPYTTAEPNKLQQKWERPIPLGSTGLVRGYEYEWRGVPKVVEDE